MRLALRLYSLLQTIQMHTSFFLFKLWGKWPITLLKVKVETPIHDSIRELVIWECKEHGLMPRSHQTFRLVSIVRLLGIMFRFRCWPTTFYTITTGDANGWCCNWPVWSTPQWIMKVLANLKGSVGRWNWIFGGLSSFTQILWSKGVVDTYSKP